MQTLFSDEDEGSEKFFNLKLNERMNQLRRNSRYLSPDQWAIRRSIQVELLKNSDISVPQSHYDNLKYKMNIIITGEQINAESKQATLNVIFQVLGSNPQVLQDKKARKVFNKMLDLAGISPKDVFDDEMLGIKQVAGNFRASQGGSIASPAAPAMPVMGQTEAVI